MKKIIWTPGRALTVAAASLLPAISASALERGMTPSGVPFAMGGIGLGERDQLHEERAHFNLWITTVTKGTGAYLSGARLVIRRSDAAEPVIDRAMDGPWFFATLPPGRYDVVATLPSPSDQRLASVIRIGADDHRQAVFRFDAPGDVDPARPRPYAGNPFGNAAAGI